MDKILTIYFFKKLQVLWQSWVYQSKSVETKLGIFAIPWNLKIWQVLWKPILRKNLSDSLPKWNISPLISKLLASKFHIKYNKICFSHTHNINIFPDCQQDVHNMNEVLSRFCSCLYLASGWISTAVVHHEKQPNPFCQAIILSRKEKRKGEKKTFISETKNA